MTQIHQTDVIVVGAGIVGLAHALAVAKRGLKVLVFERNPEKQSKKYLVSYQQNTMLSSISAQSLQKFPILISQQVEKNGKQTVFLSVVELTLKLYILIPLPTVG